jgi:hypothetical protein
MLNIGGSPTETTAAMGVTKNGQNKANLGAVMLIKRRLRAEILRVCGIL